LKTIRRVAAGPAMTAPSSAGAGSDLVTTRRARLVGASIAQTPAMFASSRGRSITSAGSAIPARFNAACRPAK
jgi:hypothetical protein